MNIPSGDTAAVLNLLVLDEDTSPYEAINQSSLGSDLGLYFAPPDKDIFTVVQKNNIHALMIDLDKDEAQVRKLIGRFKQFDPLLDVIVIGKPLHAEKVVSLINQGATTYLKKPLDRETLEEVFSEIIQKRTLRRETFLLEKKLEKKYFFHNIIGKSPYMLEIFALIDKVAKYFTSILITGETGTGKEMVARAIHDINSPNDPKLVICDCVSIPENLFESELFGYVKGAFTGADKNKKGLFDEANEGIIFLDEIGEIPLSIQAKLLRVLEQHEFRPLGSNETRKVDVKVIAATSRNLRDGIKKRTFREDLFHRLNKVEIHLPPLRERSEDIPILMRHFLDIFSKKFDKDLKGVSQHVQKLFQKYEWPGNVRELENVLERAAILAKSHFIDINDLPEYLQESAPPSAKLPFIRREHLSTLDELEKEYIIYLLDLVNNNMKKTAKILNISRTTLYNKLKKYNITH
ncbi:MAG: sigma-54 dependent transcriptional regulator [Candidatus Aminicenantes bacterium]|jgi:DNA-binding NtrC family response regulator